MPERIPRLNSKEVPLSQQKEQFSYWALIQEDGVTVKEISQRKKALEQIRAKGWETFEDYKVHGLKIDSIEKGSRKKEGWWEEYSAIGLSHPKSV